jgi:hypothetical protein
MAFAVAAAKADAEQTQLSAESVAEVRAQLPRRLCDLNSPSYEVRRRAAACVQRWIESPELGGMLAEEFQLRSLQPELPMEVRRRIELWRERLPTAHCARPRTQELADLQRLVSLLDDDSYSARVGASQRLQWLAGSESVAAPILVLLKRRLADGELSEESFRRIDEVRQVAWGVWLNRDSAGERSADRSLPPVSAAQIEHWLDDLMRPDSDRDLHGSLYRRVARQSLMDALAEDAEMPRVKAAIETRLRGTLNQDTRSALRTLLDLTRPAIVAEVWSDHKLQEPEQRLVIGEPRRFSEAANPSCFDRADDRLAHCVSGNSLTPGDYRVGVAFPAPHKGPGEREAVFHLVNLPTPRRQVAYSYYVKTDAAARLAKISRRTLDRFLGEKKLLSDPELGMLRQLDAREVSRFAARYFFLVDDGPVDEDVDAMYSTKRRDIEGESSRFGAVCAQLAVDGTREAMPGLLDAIRQKRFLSPTPLAPYRLEWLAAFSIAQRDPWPGVDAWLAENIENQQSLDIAHSDAAVIGATAAGILLERHHEKPSEFGLQLVVDPRLAELKVAGYSCGSALDAQRLRKWWQRQANIVQTTAAR